MSNLSLTRPGILQPNPLYDLLVKRVELQSERKIDINKICNTINNIRHNMSPEDTNVHYRWIDSLILHHDLINNNGILLSLVPYNAKIMDGEKGILYYFTNLPPMLQNIIAQYLEYASG